ncbi:MAG: DUF2785 domain-containing protein [Ardenticatenaceae bacterium]|nr:DUF2785 domain-containing protein [Ardenticatenaceae bacterium]
MKAEKELKTRLTQIAEDEFRVKNNREQFELALAMVRFIGSPDPALRDGLIYQAFCFWILEQEAFTAVQLHQLLDLAVDENHLFYWLGEKGTDSVFTRSFSMLLLPLLLIAHRQRPYLTQPEIVNLKETVIHYLEQEQDMRGYVPEKGWAHAVAHAADALDDLALCKELGADDLRDILTAVQRKIGTDNYVFVHEEDERMVTAVTSLLSRQVLSEAEITNWIRSFVPFVAEVEAGPTGGRYLNVKNFLRSLYFRLSGQEEYETLCPVIFEAAQEIGRFK